MIRLDPEDEHYRDRCYVMTARGGQQYAYLRCPLPVGLHRIIMDAPTGRDVDHINGDTLDNRKENLRVVTRTKNSRNTDRWGGRERTPYRGVGRHVSGLWYARIKHHGRVISCGYHASPEAANYARLVKERDLWGIEPRRLPAFIAAGLIPA